MRLACLLVLALAGCQQPAPAPKNNSAPAENTDVARPSDNSQNQHWVVTQVKAPPSDEEERVIDQLTPAQRRAYMKGFEDCLAGRYEPDPWPEAYRLGCAAANDR